VLLAVGSASDIMTARNLRRLLIPQIWSKEVAEVAVIVINLRKNLRSNSIFKKVVRQAGDAKR